MKKLKTLFAKIKQYFYYSHCYNLMEDANIATFGMCSGLSGGDVYLPYKCKYCPYLVLVEKGGAKMDGVKNE